MQINAENVHLIVDIATPIAGAMVAIIGLMIKGAIADLKEEQAKTKAELTEGQHKVLLDLNNKHAENSQAIAVHQASDEQKFDAINRSLGRIETKIDRNGNGGH